MIELERPYQFVNSRMGTVFGLKKQTHFTRHESSNKKKRMFKLHYVFTHHSIFRMACNIIRFLFCC